MRVRVRECTGGVLQKQEPTLRMWGITEKYGRERVVAEDLKMTLAHVTPP